LRAKTAPSHFGGGTDEKPVIKGGVARDFDAARGPFTDFIQF